MVIPNNPHPQSPNLQSPISPKVYFIGAGPGAPDLITLRGWAVLQRADLVIYANSLVDERLVAPARARGARVVESAALTLEEIVALMVDAVRAGRVVARLHSGDPAIYGAVHEQIVRLKAAGIPYEIVPGVPSALAAAARLGVELTVPGVAQTVIFTRTAGRTPMPPGEALQDLAAHGATLAIHLSVHRMRDVVEALLAGGAYTPDTPVAVVYKATWPDEGILRGTLADIAAKVREAGWTRHALILVGPALAPEAHEEARSHLYHPAHAHRFRPRRQRGTLSTAAGYPQPAAEKSLVVIALTRPATRLAYRLADALDADVRVPERFARRPEDAFTGAAVAEIRRCWRRYRSLVLIVPTGLAVRAIAPLLADKRSDPAVVCVDEQGRFAIPLVGGHAAGANRLAERLAALTGGTAVITTASEVQGKPALDLLGREQGWRVAAGSRLTPVAAALVNDDPVAVMTDPDLPGTVHAYLKAQFAGCKNVTFLAWDHPPPDVAGLILVTHRRVALPTVPTVLYHPPVLYVGIGCRRGTPAADLRAAVEQTFAEAALALESIAALVTAEVKQEEAGLHELARALGVPLRVVPLDALRQVPRDGLTPSAAEPRFGIPGVAEPAALVASQGRLIVPKRTFARCTVAVAVGGVTRNA